MLKEKLLFKEFVKIPQKFEVSNLEMRVWSNIAF
jgi:hypothetical protein